MFKHLLLHRIIRVRRTQRNKNTLIKKGIKVIGESGYLAGVPPFGRRAQHCLENRIILVVSLAILRANYLHLDLPEGARRRLVLLLRNYYLGSFRLWVTVP